MYLHIVALTGPLFEGEIKAVTIKTITGEITILPNHRPLLSVVTPNSLATITLPTGEKKEIAITSGFVEVTPDNQVSVIVG